MAIEKCAQLATRVNDTCRHLGLPQVDYSFKAWSDSTQAPICSISSALSDKTSSQDFMARAPIRTLLPCSALRARRDLRPVDYQDEERHKHIKPLWLGCAKVYGSMRVRVICEKRAWPTVAIFKVQEGTKSRLSFRSGILRYRVSW